MCDACGRLFVKGKCCLICLKASLHSQDYVRIVLIGFQLPSTCYVWFACDRVILAIAVCIASMELGELFKIN
jgi:hypothetical protein